MAHIRALALAGALVVLMALLVSACSGSDDTGTDQPAAAAEQVPETDSQVASPNTSDSAPTRAPALPPSSALQESGLTESYTFEQLGVSMAYPAGWLTGSSGITRLISELEVDHERAWPSKTGWVQTPRATKGYQVSLTLQAARWVRSLVDVMAFYRNGYSLKEQSELRVEQTFRGEPAVRFTGTLGFGRVVNCIGGYDSAFIFTLCLGAPSEQALAEFMPTWEQMLDSTAQTAKGDISTCTGFVDAADVERISGLTGVQVQLRQFLEGVSCDIVAENSDQTRSLSLLISYHNTAEAAERAYRKLVDIFEDQPEFKEGALGPNSFEVMEDLIAAGELTPVVGLLEGASILNISDNGGERLLVDSIDELLELARIVQRRLP